MEDFAKTSMLFDIYGGLLTDKKKRVMEMYHEDDMSLSEIAEELEVWFMKYKGIYRADSKESLLSRVSKVVFWYADRLRGL